MIVNNVSPQPTCITLYSKEAGKELWNIDQQGLDRLKTLLRDDDVCFIAQYACFDTINLSVEDPELFGLFSRAYKMGRVYCTKLAEILLNTADPETEGRASHTVFIDRGADHPKRWLPMTSNTLGGLAYKYLGIDLSADKESELRVSYGALRDVPVDQWTKEQREYAMDDAMHCHDVFLKQVQRSKRLAERVGMNVLSDLGRQSYAEFTLQVSATVVGLGIDVDKIDDAVDSVMQVHDQEITTALSFGLFKPNKNERGYSVNGEQEQKILQRAIDLVGIDHPTTKSGKLSTAKISMDNLYDGMDYCLSYRRNLDHKLPLSDEDVAELAAIQSAFKSKQRADGAWKEKKTFLDALRNASLNPDSRLRYMYKGLMETGRTSSSKPNCQNIPRKGEARACIKPRDGHIFIQADYSNAELRTLAQAHINEDRPSRLAVEYQNNPHFDPHLFMAVQIIGRMTYEEGQAILADKTHAQYAELKEKRQLSKIANFGYAGGLGAEQFIDYAKGYGTNLTSSDSSELRDAWLNTWTEMGDYFRERGDMLEGAEQADILDRTQSVKATGKARRSRHVTDKDYGCVYRFQSTGRVRYLRKFTIAANTPFQGIASDGAKDALIAVFEDCYFTPSSPLYGCKPVLFVHDEIVISAPFNGDVAKATAQARRLQALMEEGMNKHTPDIPAVAEPCLTFKWTKDAESDIDENGNLTIYGAES